MQREHSRNTGARLARALLGYYVAVVGVIVLVPFRFVMPERLGWVSLVDGADFAANVLLFVPFGFLYRLSLRPGRRPALAALAAGTAVSLLIECVQMFAPERYASLLDVMANGCGAWLGAVICGAVARRLAAPALVGRLSLELPLMGLVYLLIPLLWAGSLSIGDNLLRLWMLALPVAFGATLLGLVQRHHFGPMGAATPATMASAAAGGVVLGAFPALLATPAMVAGLALLAAAVVLRHGLLPPRPAERRFEEPALRTALPFYAAYLAAAAFAPLTEPPTSLGFAVAAHHQVQVVEILRLLHGAVAFSLLGYMIAEMRGRLEHPFATTMRRVLLVAAPAAAGTIAVGRILLGVDGAWTAGNAALWLVLAIGGAQYGAWLYHLQRDHVQALTGARPAAARADAAAQAPDRTLSSQHEENGNAGHRHSAGRHRADAAPA